MSKKKIGERYPERGAGWGKGRVRGPCLGLTSCVLQEHDDVGVGDGRRGRRGARRGLGRNIGRGRQRGGEGGGRGRDGAREVNTTTRQTRSVKTYRGVADARPDCVAPDCVAPPCNRRSVASIAGSRRGSERERYGVKTKTVRVAEDPSRSFFCSRPI